MKIRWKWPWDWNCFRDLKFSIQYWIRKKKKLGGVFPLRHLKNNQNAQTVIFDRVVFNGDPSYEFIPMPNGWLVTSFFEEGDGSPKKAVSSCFVPDPKHRLRFELVEFTGINLDLENKGMTFRRNPIDIEPLDFLNEF